MVKEWKRILLNRKILLVIALLLVANILLFGGTSLNQSIRLTIDTTHLRMNLLNCYRDGDITVRHLEKQLEEIDVILRLFDYQAVKQKYPDEYLLLYQTEETVLRNEYTELSDRFDREQYDETVLRNDRAALSSIYESSVYSFTYQEKLAQIQQNAELLSEINIFQAAGGVADKNIQKTTRDYAALKDVEITAGNDASTVALQAYNLMPLFGIVFSITLVGKVLEEQKYGLRPLIFSCVNGRRTLMLWRVCSLLTGSVLFSVMLYGSTMLVALWLFGPVDVLRMAQSVPGLFGMTTPMTLGELWGLYLVLGIVVQVAITGVSWCVFSFLHHRAIAITVMAGILGSSLLLYCLMPDQSVLSPLKYANLAAVMDLVKVISTYCNVSIGPLVVENNWITAGTLLLTPMITYPLCVWYGMNKYSIFGYGRIYCTLHALFETGTRFYHRCVSRMPFLGIEAYKALVVRRGAVLLLALMLVLLQVYQPKEPMYAGKAEFMQEFYTDYANQGLSPNVQNYVQALQDKLNEVEKKWTLAVEDYNSGRIDIEEYEIAFRIYEAYDVQREGLKEIQSVLEYIRQQKEQGYIAVLVDPTPYYYLIGTMSMRDRIMVWASIFVVAVLCSGIFSGEKRNGLHSVLFSTVHGRGWLALQKVILCLIFSGMVYSLFIAVKVASIVDSYGLESLAAPAHSLPFFSQCPVNWSIGSALLVYILSGGAVYALIAMIACLLSQVTSYVFSVLGTVLIVILPEVLGLVGVNLFNQWNIIQVQEYSASWVTKGDWGPVLILIGSISVLTVCVCWMWKTRKMGGRK